MTPMPVKLERNGAWIVAKIDLLDESLKVEDTVTIEIPYKSIVDVDEKKNVITLRMKGDQPPPLRIASVEKVLLILRSKVLMSCSAYRLMAYFMSPAVRGGVMVTNAQWEKGAIAVLKTAIWFVSGHKQVSVPIREVTGIELTKREVQKRQVDVIKIDHLESNDLVTSYVLCPMSTLQVLYNYLRDTTKDLDMRGDELDPVAAQVGMLIYSGMDSVAIEKMLSIEHKDLDAIYEKLIKIGIAEVMMIRREVQLTPKGVRYITEAVKPPTP
jgi:helix-turn-helix protein